MIGGREDEDGISITIIDIGVGVCTALSRRILLGDVVLVAVVVLGDTDNDVRVVVPE